MAKFSTFLAILTFIAILNNNSVLTKSINGEEKSVISPLISLSPNYELEFFLSEDSATFHVIAQTTGYVGFGFTLSENMVNSDIFIASVREGENYSGDYHGLANGSPTLDDVQNWELINATETATATELYFSRLFTTTDSSGQDIEINEGQIRVIFAIGSTDDLQYHGAERGSAVITIREDPTATTITDGSSTTSDTVTVTVTDSSTASTPEEVSTVPATTESSSSIITISNILIGITILSNLCH